MIDALPLASRILGRNAPEFQEQRLGIALALELDAGIVLAVVVIVPSGEVRDVLLERFKAGDVRCRCISLAQACNQPRFRNSAAIADIAVDVVPCEGENRALEFALLLTMPAAVALFLAAEPIIRVLFERGAFTAVDTKATAAMVAALALGLPAYVMIKVLHPSFFAREDTKTPMIYAGISMATTVVLSSVLFVALGATGIAIATMLSGWLNVALLIATLRHREGFTFDHTFRHRFAGIIAASALMGTTVFALVGALDPWLTASRGLGVQATALLTLVLTGLVVYLGAAHLFGAVHVRDLMEAPSP